MSEIPHSKRSGDLSSGHTVKGYDRELSRLRSLILEMGDHMIEQIRSVLAALLEGDDHLAYRVLDREPQIDYLSLDADEEVFQLITRRQPAALDLRIVLALSKIASEIERAADKGARIATQALESGSLAQATAGLPTELRVALKTLGERACCMLDRSLEAVASFDVNVALDIFEDEPRLYAASQAMRKGLEAQPCADGEQGLSPAQLARLLTIGHALERAGNHATNIAEQVIYVAEGQDVRYRNREILIETLRRHHPAPAAPDQ